LWDVAPIHWVLRSRCFGDEILVPSSRDELSVFKGCNNARLGTWVSKFREDVTVSSLRFDVLCRHWAFGFSTFQVLLEASGSKWRVTQLYIPENGDLALFHVNYTG
jgi:hypothetical protein